MYLQKQANIKGGVKIVFQNVVLLYMYFQKQPNIKGGVKILFS